VTILDSTSGSFIIIFLSVVIGKSTSLITVALVIVVQTCLSPFSHLFLAEQLSLSLLLLEKVARKIEPEQPNFGVFLLE
jgi:hypothetical protein